MSHSTTTERALRLNQLAREEIQKTYKLIEPILAGTSSDYKQLVAQCNKAHLLSLIVRETAALTVHGEYPQGAIPQINYARTQLGSMPVSAEFKSALEELLLIHNAPVERLPHSPVGAWAHD